MNIGIELASEHAGRSTRNITARNNLVYDSTAIGIAIGGYDRRRGSTEDCVIVNNTVVNTDGVELLVQFDTRDNVIANNVIVAGPGHVFVENPYRENVGNVLDHNLYSSVDGSSAGTWQWKGVGYGGFDRWSARSGNDRQLDLRRSRFVDAAAHDFSLGAGSPAVDAGAFLAASGATDLGGEPRAQAGGIDLGAFEVTAPPPSPTPSIPEPVTYAGDLTWLASSNGGGRRRSTGATGSAPPMMAGRSGSGPRRSITGSGRTRRRGSSWTWRAGARSSSPTSVSTRRSAIEGSVVFEVWGDGQRLAVSGIVRGPQAAVPIAADLEGVDRMTLVVTPGGDGNAFDHADWGDARLACCGLNALARH